MRCFFWNSLCTENGIDGALLSDLNDRMIADLFPKSIKKQVQFRRLLAVTSEVEDDAAESQVERLVNSNQ